MAEFINVKIIGVDPVSAAANVIARSSTGGSTSGANWQLLNIHSLGNLWVHSASGGFASSMTASSACAAVSGGQASGSIHSSNLIGAYGINAASAVPLSAAAFLRVATDNNQVWLIPLLAEPKS